MTNSHSTLLKGFFRLTAALSFSFAGQVPLEAAPQKQQKQPLPIEQRAQISYDTYILGPGDQLQIELEDLPELSGTFAIGPDGTLYLPRLRALYVEGLTLEELRFFITRNSTYVRDPQIYIRPVVYRPVRVYVGGEVKRPGYYTLSGNTDLSRLSQTAESQQLTAGTALTMTRPGVFPTVFDAIRSAEGVTPYTDLSQVQVIRKCMEGLRWRKKKFKLSFINNRRNESQNICLFDGDTLNIGKSSIMRDQLTRPDNQI